VVRIADGEVSPYLTDDLRPGDQVELRGPVGGYFVWEPPLGGPLLLVAGGSGVAPLMAMIRLRAAAGSDVDTRLLLSSRGWDDIIYRDELERLNGNGLRVVHTLTMSQPPGWAGYARRVDAEMLAEVGRAPPNGHASISAARRRSPRPRPRHLWASGTGPRRSRPNGSGRREAEMDELMLDGNAVAGMLSQVFAVEMTTATMTCGHCGTSGAVGAMHVFRGAGIVMRCPNCDHAGAKIVEDGTRIWMNFGGMQALEINR
jgi:hypothetical protein